MMRSNYLMPAVALAIQLMAAQILLATTGEQVALLAANDATPNDRFGTSVSLFGNTALVGADGDNLGQGSAYVFRTDSAGTWSQVAKISANDGQTGEVFGRAVSLWQNIALVGAPEDNTLAGTNAGSAYLYRDQGMDQWTQLAKLTPNDAMPEQFFGGSVALFGDTAVVSSVGDSQSGFYSGSAYVFQDDGSGNWTQVAKLVASDASANDQFGISVSVYNDTVLVGALWADGVRQFSGGAYVFKSDSTGNWKQIAKLTASDGRDFDEFGRSVALYGNLALVGASSDDGIGGNDAGSAYLFRESGTGTWTQIAKLTSSDASVIQGAFADYFGWSVSLFEKTAVVGAIGHNLNGIDDAGAAYLFQEDSMGIWKQIGKLAAKDAMPNDWAGWAVGLSNRAALVGAYLKDDAGESSGSAYIFEGMPSIPEPSALVMAALGLIGVSSISTQISSLSSPIKRSK